MRYFSLRCNAWNPQPKAMAEAIVKRPFPTSGAEYLLPPVQTKPRIPVIMRPIKQSNMPIFRHGRMPARQPRASMCDIGSEFSDSVGWDMKNTLKENRSSVNPGLLDEIKVSFECEDHLGQHSCFTQGNCGSSSTVFPQFPNEHAHAPICHSSPRRCRA